MYDFPNSPTVGQIVSTLSGSFKWDGVKWAPVGGGGYLPLIGGTLSGDLSISETTPNLILNKAAAGQACTVWGRTNNSARWAVALGDGSAESGSNAGSNFTISRCSDANAIIDVPLTINRASGQTTFAENVNIAPASGGAGLVLNGSVGTYRMITAQTSGAARWAVVYGDSGSESGSNAGSNFGIYRYNDAGAYIDSPFTINRANGQVQMLSYSVTVAGIQGRAGTSGGAYGGNYYNFYWTSSALQGWVDGSNLGNVSFVSDYRIKKDVTELPGTWDIVKRLRPVKYTQRAFKIFTADDKERWGFVAHELQEATIQDAATGAKDDPVAIQSPNPWTVIATLTKALQEAMARIEALEARHV